MVSRDGLEGPVKPLEALHRPVSLGLIADGLEFVDMPIPSAHALRHVARVPYLIDLFPLGLVDCRVKPFVANPLAPLVRVGYDQSLEDVARESDGLGYLGRVDRPAPVGNRLQLILAISACEL